MGEMDRVPSRRFRLVAIRVWQAMAIIALLVAVGYGVAR
jgi:hypothetical protein